MKPRATLILAAIGGVLLCSQALAQSRSTTCVQRLSVRGYYSTCTTVDTPAPKPPEAPIRRGPGSQEDVAVAPSGKRGGGAPEVSNFCGPGFRAKADGSCAPK